MLAQNLKDARLKKGITQVELAQAVGVTQQAIAYYENGINIPALPIAVALSQVLEVSLDDLVK